MIRNKEVYYVVAAAGGQMPVNRAVKSLQVYTNCLGGTKERGVISVIGVWDAGLVKGTQAIDQAYTMGKNA